MNTNKFTGKIVVITVFLICACAITGAHAQGTVFWRNTAANGNWANTDASNVNNWYRSTPNGWDVRRPDLAANQWSATSDPKAYNITIFDNGTQSTTTLNGDVGGAKFHVAQLLFREGTSRTFNGSSGGYLAMSNSGGTAKIESESGATGTYTFNVPILFEESTEINAVHGNLVFNSGSTITNNGFALVSYTASGKQAEFKGVISGSGALEHKGAGLVILDAANTYTGATTVEASGGVVQIKNASGLGATNAGTTVSSGAALEIVGSLGTISEGITLNGSGVSSGGALRNISGSSTIGTAVTLGSASRINSDSGTLTLDVASGNAVTGTQNLTVGGAGNVTISDNVNIGTAKLVKDGSGVLTLGAANNYTGNTEIDQGTLAIGSSGGLNSASMLYLGSGGNNLDSTLNLAGTTTFSNNIQVNQALNNGAGGRTIAKTDAASQTISGNITNNKSTTVSVSNSGGNLTASGAISGSGALVKTGSGTFTLSGNSASYSGGVYIDAGTVVQSAGSMGGSGQALAIGAEVGGGDSAAFTMAGDSLTSGRNVDIRAGSGSRTINFNNSAGTTNTISGTVAHAKGFTLNVGNSGATAILSGVISSNTAGGSTISVTGNGTLGVNNTGNTTDARWSVGSGSTLAIGSSRNLGENPGGYYSDKVTLAGGTLRATNGFSLNSNVGVQVTSASTISVDSGSTLTNPAVMGGTANITKSGAGGLVLSAANTNSGKWTVSAGTLSISSAGNLGNATGGDALTLAGGVLQSTADMTLGSRGITLGTGGGTINVSSGSLTNTAGLNGSAALSKTGSGALALATTAGNYSGTATINGGSLSVNTALSNATVNIASGGTLTGAGTLGAVTVQSGGVIAPGNSPGNLSVSSLTLNGGGSYNWELTDTTGSAGAGWDVITVGGGNGAVTLNATSLNQFTINIIATNPSNWAAGTSRAWDIIDGGSWVSAFDASAFAISTNSFTASGSIGTFSVANNGGNLQLVYTASITDYAVNVSSGSANQGDATGGAGQFTGARALVKTGAGTLVMTNGANDYTGTTTVQAGTMQINVNAPNGSAGALGNASSAVVVGDSGTTAAAGFNIGAASVTNSRSLDIIAGSGAADRTVGTTITSGTAVQAGNVNLGTATTLSAASGGTMVYTGVLSNSGNITVTNGGTTVLSGANTYTGTTTVGSGATLVAANNSALGTTAGNTTVNSGGTLGLSNGITEDEALNVNGTGVGNGGAIRNLSGSNTLSGNVTLAGATRVNSDAGLLTVSGNVNGANNALTVGGAGNTTISGNITNSTAGFTKDGAGTATLSGVNTYTGATTVSAGTLAISGSNAISDSSAVSVASDSTLQVGGTETIGSLAGAGGTVALGANGLVVGGLNTATTYSGVITGSGSFSKNGTGTQTLSGNSSTYTGEVILNNGTLRAGNNGAFGTGTVTVNFDSGTGTRVLAAADSSSYTLNNNFNQYYDSLTIGEASGGTGSLTLGGSGKTFFLGNDGDRTRTNTVLGNHTIASAITGTNNFVKAGSGTLTLSGSDANTFTGSTTVSAGTLVLNKSANTAAVPGQVTVNSGATLRTDAANQLNNQYVVNDGTVNLNSNGQSLALAGSGTVSLGSATMTNNNTGNDTFSGRITGTGGLVKTGSATFTLSGTGEYTGGTTINQGTLAVSGSQASSAYTLSGGSLTTSGSANLSDTASVTINSNASTFTVGANDTIGSIAGTAGTINITNSGTLTLGANTTSTFSGVIAGNGSLVKGGTGSLTLDGSAANTYSGTTTVNAGTLILAKTGGVNALAGTPTINSNGTIRLGAANQFAGDTTFLTVNSGGVFDMNGFNETLAIQGAGSVTLGGGTMTINPTGTDTFSGGISGAGGIVKTNTGTQILSGNSSYTGTTTVGQGVLVAASANALGATNGATTINTGTALHLSNTSSMTVAENITVNGTGVGGIGGALVNTAGTNTVSGNLTLGSNARLAATGGRLTVSGNVGGGSNVFFVGTEENIAISGAISGAGNTQDGTTTSLFKDGAKTLTLSGNNTYTGDTRISQGNVTVASGGSLGNGSEVFITTNGTLTVNTDTTVATLQEWGNNNGGTASIGAGATVTVNGNATNFYMNSISGAGGLTKAGSSTMNLYGTQSYTGTTTVSAGKLSSAVALASTNVTVSGGTFEANGANILGNTAAVNVSGGTYDLGGNDTVGSFSISSGSIAGTNTLTASTYALDGGTVTANLGGGTATASSGTTALNGTLGATTVNVSGGTVNLGSNNRLADGATVNVSSGALGMGTRTDTIGTLNVSGGSVTGSTGNKLTATTYNLTGGTVGANLGAGTLNANSGSATLNGTADATTVNVGGGALTLGSANRLATSNAAVTISNGGALTLGGNETIASLAGSGGSLALGNGNLTLVGNSYSNTFGGVISGNGSLSKYGTGYLVLSGNNTYGGGTFIYGGTLDSDSTDAFGTGWITVFSGGTLDIFSHNVTNHIVNSGGTIRTGTNVVVSDVVATNGTTDVAGSGSTIVDAGGSATVNVTGNSVTISNVEGSANVNVGGTSAAVGTVSGGTVNLSNSATGATITTASAGTVNANASGVTISNVQGSAAVNIAGTGASVRTVSGGTVTLSNTATGATVTTASGGTVNANASGTTVGTVSGASLNVSGANGRVGTLSGGSVAANAAGLVISNKTGGNLAVSNGVTVGLQAGNSSGVISGAGGIAKQGNGVLTLSGVNTLSGATTVEQGTLVVNGSLNNSDVTVQSGARIGGSGSARTLTLNGIVAPGNSAGTMVYTEGAAWGNTGVYDWEIYNLAPPDGTGTPGPGGWDLFSVTGGTLNLNGITTAGGFTINLITLQSNNSTPGALANFDPAKDYIGDSAWMIASAPIIEGFDAGDFTLNASGFVGATGTFAIEERSITGGQGLFITYTGGGSEPIPEPGTWAAAALLAGAAGYVRWRRRKQAEPKA